MRRCDEIFKELEDHDEITVAMLSYSKIGKIIGRIEQKDDLPFQERFRFRERAEVLVEQWKRLCGIEGDDYAKGPRFKWLSNMDSVSFTLHDAMRARRRCVGTIGGLNEVIVEDASGRTATVTLPCS